jgi:hypothetical protein
MLEEHSLQQTEMGMTHADYMPLMFYTALITALRMYIKNYLKLNSVAWVREPTLPTVRPLLAVEVSAKFYG